MSVARQLLTVMAAALLTVAARAADPAPATVDAWVDAYAVSGDPAVRKELLTYANGKEDVKTLKPEDLRAQLARAREVRDKLALALQRQAFVGRPADFPPRITSFWGFRGGPRPDKKVAVFPRHWIRLLALLREVNAPLPVDQLASLVEQGLGRAGEVGYVDLGEERLAKLVDQQPAEFLEELSNKSRLDLVMSLLAESGHYRARELIRYHRRLTAQSFTPNDCRWRDNLAVWETVWEAANAYIEKGEGSAGGGDVWQWQLKEERKDKTKILTLELRPGQYSFSRTNAAKMARKLFEAKQPVEAIEGAAPNPQTEVLRAAAAEFGLTWNKTLSDEYLAAQMRIVTRHLQVPPTDAATLGRTYEKWLLEAAEKGVGGDFRALRDLFGTDWFDDQGDEEKNYGNLTVLCWRMTSPAAAKLKVRLKDRMPVAAQTLLFCHPDHWLDARITEHFHEVSERLGDVPTLDAIGIYAMVLRDRERPLSPQERGFLPLLLRHPRMVFPDVGEDLLRALMEKEREKGDENDNVFAGVITDAEKDGHASLPVVKTILDGGGPQVGLPVFVQWLKNGLLYDYGKTPAGKPVALNLQWLAVVAKGPADPKKVIGKMLRELVESADLKKLAGYDELKKFVDAKYPVEKPPAEKKP